MEEGNDAETGVIFGGGFGEGSKGLVGSKDGSEMKRFFETLEKISDARNGLSRPRKGELGGTFANDLGFWQFFVYVCVVFSHIIPLYHRFDKKSRVLRVKSMI